MSTLPNVTRRQLLASSLPLLAGASQAFAQSKRPLGVQLYTVRGTLMKDSERIIKAIADIGYKEIEGAGRTDLITLLPLIRQHGMKAVSCHVEVPLLTGDWEIYGLKKVELAEAIDSVKKAGVQYFTMAYINPKARGDSDFYKKTADRMNVVGEACHKAGLQFAYHNHAFEFAGKAGERPIDIFKERLDKKLVALEMDIFWVSVAGHDPVEMLKEWKGRVALLHLKDKGKDQPVQYTETVEKSAFKEVGNGSLDFAAILKAAPAAGVKHYFVEQDQTPGDPLVSLKQSFDYLSKI
ncbi:MAG: Xylose isomerase domain protein barrel [Bryobacterales bacterium]|nr:Xylose isomerase domain protein barrel [Bryobacterales bacterium]